MTYYPNTSVSERPETILERVRRYAQQLEGGDQFAQGVSDLAAMVPGVDLYNQYQRKQRGEDPTYLDWGIGGLGALPLASKAAKMVAPALKPLLAEESIMQKLRADQAGAFDPDAWRKLIRNVNTDAATGVSLAKAYEKQSGELNDHVLKALLQDDSAFSYGNPQKIIVQSPEKEILGASTYEMSPELRDLYINYMGAHEKGVGIGSSMLDHINSIGNRMKLNLSVNPLDDNARGFWNKKGFIMEGEDYLPARRDDAMVKYYYPPKE